MQVIIIFVTRMFEEAKLFKLVMKMAKLFTLMSFSAIYCVCPLPPPAVCFSQPRFVSHVSFMYIVYVFIL